MTLRVFKCPFCGYRFRADPEGRYEAGATTIVRSWRESKAAFERIVTYKHAMLKIAGLFLVLGALALFAAMGAYLAG
jgi:hypothetical protein